MFFLLYGQLKYIMEVKVSRYRVSSSSDQHNIAEVIRQNESELDLSTQNYIKLIVTLSSMLWIKAVIDEV